MFVNDPAGRRMYGQKEARGCRHHWIGFLAMVFFSVPVNSFCYNQNLGKNLSQCTRPVNVHVL